LSATAERVRVCAAEGCERPLPDDAHPRRLYCSDACRYETNNAVKSVASAAALRRRVVGICGWCEGPIIGGRLDQRYCSAVCRYDAANGRRAVAGAARVCALETCGSPIGAGASPGKRYCCKTCRTQALVARRKRDREAAAGGPSVARVRRSDPLVTTGGPPFDLVRARLAESRAAGESFDPAWAKATRWPASRGNDVTDRAVAVRATVDAWRRAYENEPAKPAERAAGRALAEAA
jgi:hypothetical protein